MKYLLDNRAKNRPNNSVNAKIIAEATVARRPHRLIYRGQRPTPQPKIGG